MDAKNIEKLVQKAKDDILKEVKSAGLEESAGLVFDSSPQ